MALLTLIIRRIESVKARIIAPPTCSPLDCSSPQGNGETGRIMPRAHWFILAMMFCHHTQVQSDILDLPSETPNNFEPFTLSSRCPSYGIDKFFGAVAEGDEISIYASVYQSGFVAPCYDNSVEVGPFASGSYTINYYTSENGGPFLLHNSQNIVIDKVSENEPAAGRVIISGEAAEDHVVATSHTVSDSNGMGEIRYQWYRNGQPIPGAIYESYLLTDDDVGHDIHCAIIFEDGLGVTESVISLPVGAPGEVANTNDQPVGSVYIRGSVSEGSTLTIDTSGLYDPDGIAELNYHWKRRYRTYSTLAQDIGSNSSPHVPTINDRYFYLTAVVTYTDLHGTRERAEANITGRLVPTDRPVVTPPIDLTLPATGALTRVDPGMATARDDDEGVLDTDLRQLVSNGIVTPPPTEGQLDLPPGTHLLTWAADDSDGITGEGIQIVRIDPIVNFGGDRNGPVDGNLGCPLILNGEAARFPVTVPYILSGTLLADGSEQLLQTATYQIAQPQPESMLALPDGLFEQLSDYASLQLTMAPPTNAVMGEKNTCRILLSSDNIAPDVTLTGHQGEVPSRIVSQTGGAVTLTATVEDLNSGDSHSYDWSESDGRLTDLDSEVGSLTFDPADLEPGLYRVRLSVSDTTASADTELSLRVVDATSELTDVDSDGDGETDFAEGNGDSDADGIPDYLDPAGLPGNVLPQTSGSDNGYLMEAESGLLLTLGDIAFFAQHHGALISRSDILEYIANGLDGEADAERYPYAGGLFDFRIDGINQVGASVKVVIPQRQVIESGSVYRKLTPTGWGEFVADEHNLIKSAPGEAGLCPSPGDNAYQAGLSEGAWCVELTIEDGGPNDADGRANGRIADPGGVTTTLSDDSGSGSGGGGIFSPWLFLLLVMFHCLRVGLNVIPALLKAMKQQRESDSIDGIDAMRRCPAVTGLRPTTAHRGIPQHDPVSAT
ncbi:MAG: choice-of-anchor U domain-containing protein [Candidatus Thiodiazotropha endolucinida]